MSEGNSCWDGGKVGVPDIGFIAQELLEAQERCGVKVPNLVLEADPDRLEAAYGVLVPILTRAIQQLTEMLDCEKAERKRLEERVEALLAAGADVLRRDLAADRRAALPCLDDDELAVRKGLGHEPDDVLLGRHAPRPWLPFRRASFNALARSTID